MRAYMHVCRFPRGSTPPLDSHRTLELNPAAITRLPAPHSHTSPHVLVPRQTMHPRFPSLSAAGRDSRERSIATGISFIYSFYLVYFVVASRAQGHYAYWYTGETNPPVDVTFLFGKEFKGGSDVTENRTTPLCLDLHLPSIATLVYAPPYRFQRVQVPEISTSRPVRTLQPLVVTSSTVV